MNLCNTSGILRNLKIWRGNRHIFQARSPLLQNFGESTRKSDRQQTSQQPECDKFSHLFSVLGVVVANPEDKEQENSSLVSECKNLTATSSNRERTPEGRFTKTGKGTNKKN